MKTMGIDDVAAFTAPVKKEPRVAITSSLSPNQVFREFGKPGGASLDLPVLEQDVRALVPAVLLQAQSESTP
jgi:hypothetical protein